MVLGGQPSAVGGYVDWGFSTQPNLRCPQYRLLRGPHVVVNFRLALTGNVSGWSSNKVIMSVSFALRAIANGLRP